MTTLQFESDFRFDMDEINSMCSHNMSCPSTSTSFSSASSAYDPFTPTSRRSTPNEPLLDFDGSCVPFGGSGSVDLTSSSSNMGKYIFGPLKQEPEQLSFTEALPTTPMKKLEPLCTDYEHMLEMNMVTQAPMGSLTPSNSFGMYTISPEAGLGPASFMMTPTQSMSGSEMTETSSSWSYHNESPISFFPAKTLPSQDNLDILDLERHSQSPFTRTEMQGRGSPHRARHHRKMMVHEIQRKTSDLQRAQIRASRRRTEKEDSGSVDIVRRAMCKCDYPGCTKAFRRNEHLKRHKQTYHGEGPNRFSCEFCGKDQFNRQDNLNNHRKLHARPNSRNRGVEFIPAAVAIIEQEERSRKRRAPPKSKTTTWDKEDDDDDY